MKFEVSKTLCGSLLLNKLILTPSPCKRSVFGSFITNEKNNTENTLFLTGFPVIPVIPVSRISAALYCTTDSFPYPQVEKE